jgi:Telomeric repeat-binding factor 2.
MYNTPKIHILGDGVVKKMYLLMIVFTVIFAGCTSTSKTQPVNSVAETQKDESPIEPKEEPKEENEVQEIKVGDVISGNSCEITVNSAELTYDVVPDNTSGFYTHYQSDQGKVYISVDVSAKNIAKQNLLCDEIMQVTADYNNGYTYSAFPVVDDSSTGFTYANISQIDPLETKGMKYLIDCPQEVEESTNPLYLIFTLDKKDYKLVIR